VTSIVDYRRPVLSEPPIVDYVAFTAGLDPEGFKRTVRRMENRGLYVTLTVGLSTLQSHRVGDRHSSRRARWTRPSP
jgi:hypothetical protein